MIGDNCSVFIQTVKCRYSWSYLLEQVERINQEILDSNLNLFAIAIKTQIANKEAFDKRYLQILIAFLIDRDCEKYGSTIQSLLESHEDHRDKDELDLWVSILESNIRANQDSLLGELDALRFGARSKGADKSVYLAYEQESDFEDRKKPRRAIISMGERIRVIINQRKNFLIYTDHADLLKDVKRFRVKESFEYVVNLIQEYVSDNNIDVELVLENNQLKVIFERPFPHKKQAYVRSRVA